MAAGDRQPFPEPRRHRRRVIVFAAAALVTAMGTAERSARSQTASPTVSARSSSAAQAAPSRIAFMAFYDPAKPTLATALYVVNADGSARRMLTRNAWSIEAPAWSPDGRKLAFERRVGPLAKGQCACDIDLFVMNANGSGQQNLTRNPVYDRHPVWSSDGQTLAFVRYRDVWVMNADGSDQRRLTPNPQGDMDPVWSPDGQQIAYLSYRALNWDIWVMNADGSGHRNLTRNRAQDYNPTWSPDGRKIAFVRTRNSWRFHGHPCELFVMDANGGGERRLARVACPGVPPAWLAFPSVRPAWSPEGRKLLFVSVRDGNREIYVINSDGSGQRRLTRNRASDSSPAWSPDSRRIAFISTRGGLRGIYVMNADRSQQRKLTRGIRRIGVGFAWSPTQK